MSFQSQGCSRGCVLVTTETAFIATVPTQKLKTNQTPPAASPLSKHNSTQSWTPSVCACHELVNILKCKNQGGTVMYCHNGKQREAAIFGPTYSMWGRTKLHRKIYKI